MNRKIRKTFLLCISLIGLTLVAEAGFFAFFKTDEQRCDPKEAELVIVFDGDRGRVKKGYELGNGGLASRIMISPAPSQKLRVFEKAYGRRSNLDYLIEDRARTTFENALFAARLIRDNDIGSVVLVTSGYHLPRSYFLLKMALMGSRVKLETCGVAETLPEAGGSGRWVRNLKITYNEMVRFWGSLGEGVFYKVRGKLPENSSKEIEAIRVLKGMLLFEV